MITRQLGNSDLHLTPLGVGAWAIGGGGWAFAWGPQDDRESIDAIRAALDAGLNWIDTAAVYGLGHSEEIVGQAIKGRATRPLVFTKCARNWTADRQIVKRLKRDDIRQECENSPAAPRRGRHRPLPDSLARARRGCRGRLGDPGAPQGRGQGPLDRRVELLGRPTGSHPRHRPGHVTAAAVFGRLAGD